MEVTKKISHKILHTVSKVKKIRKRTRIYILGGVVAATSLVFLLVLLLFVAKNVSAEAADNVLRPLLGEKNTLALEAVYFGIQDKVNAVKYTLFGERALSVERHPLSLVKVIHADTIDLRNISPNLNLPSLPGEGIWSSITQNLFPNQTVMAKTFIRPDPTHPYAIAYLVKMDMHKLGIGAVAGTYYPGGVHKAYGPGIVPKNIQDAGTLLAAFNGGFQEKDGQYGMVVGNTTYVPLKMNMPTFIMHTDGSAAFTTYTGQMFPYNVTAARQNGSYLLENGIITPFVEQGSDNWGRTITNSIYTWRSGLGMTKNGNLVYAAGNSLIPQTLAKALLEGGAVNAIQLDINPPWVRFITYQSLGNGQYTFSPLIPVMSTQGGIEYLRRYNKDFFYIYKK